MAEREEKKQDPYRQAVGEFLVQLKEEEYSGQNFENSLREIEKVGLESNQSPIRLFKTLSGISRDLTALALENNDAPRADTFLGMTTRYNSVLESFQNPKTPEGQLSAPSNPATLSPSTQAKQ